MSLMKALARSESPSGFLTSGSMTLSIAKLSVASLADVAGVSMLQCIRLRTARQSPCN